MKKSKSLLLKLDSRIALIERMSAEDPERNIKCIIATTGSTFYDDLELLSERCNEVGKIELAMDIER